METYLRNLSNIVSSQVQEIESLLKKKNLTFPSPNEPFTPPSEAARQDPEILTAISNLAAAADQLATVTRQPHQPLLECATAVNVLLHERPNTLQSRL
jgi:outer membrane protein TolC